MCDEMAARGWYVQAQLGDFAKCAAVPGAPVEPELPAAVQTLDPDALPDDVLGALLPMADLEPGAAFRP
ncbi:MAG: hypothetical protein ACXVGB_11250 [Mycobacteriaceae bacterium]